MNFRNQNRAADMTLQRSAPVLFGLTLFLSAFLLFAIQPMIAKMALPLLGGSPGVWNTAMVFFQSILLGGYLYAHVSARYLPFPAQLLLHFIVLGLVALFLPIALATGWEPPGSDMPAFWLIGLLAASVGLPFFAIAANSSLLQRWYSLSDTPSSHDPYFLYSASNFGSIIALLLYPVLIQPIWSLDAQGRLWGVAYGALVIAILLCALLVWYLGGRHVHGKPRIESTPALTIQTRAHWALLAFIPSSLMLGVTSYITTDIASVPLLWVVPLAVYLLTFIIVFARKPLIQHRWMVWAHPLFLIVLALTVPIKNFSTLAAAVLHLVAFFVIAMMCHGELARRRPHTGHLTEFYLWLSIGGILGGAFNSFLAPAIFNGVFEYPLVLLLSCLIRPFYRAAGERCFQWQDAALPLVLLALLFTPHQFFDLQAIRISVYGFDLILTVFSLVLMTMLAWSARARPFQLALSLAAIYLLWLPFYDLARIELQARSFFGVVRVYTDQPGDKRLLRHGSTIHGAQFTDATRWRTPLMYYHRQGPLGDIFSGMRAQRDLGQVGIVGLGAGAITCYRRSTEQWALFEIDPLIIDIATNPRYFHYLQQCAGDSQIVVGDARLSLKKAPDATFDLIVIDAFSSDSIPTHLVTREAIALYRRLLTEDGVVALHVSNRVMNLLPLMASLAADAGLAAWYEVYGNSAGEIVPDEAYGTTASWVIMAPRQENIAAIIAHDGWHTLADERRIPVWTDDHSNILDVLIHPWD